MSLRDGANFSAKMHAPAGGGGLEDLFGHRDEPLPLPAAEDETPIAKRRSRLRWILINLLVVAAMTVVIVATLRSADVDISVVFVVTALIALRLVLLAVQWAGAPAPLKRSALRELSDKTSADSLRAAVRRWELTLQWAENDPDRYSRNVLPVLAELADERLRLRHGITRQSDPRRARELLGDPLWAALHDRGRHVPKTRELESYVDSLEKL